MWGAKRGNDSPATAVKPATADAAVDPMAHLNAVLAALRPDEVQLAMQMANALPFAEKLAYAQQLIAMPVPEALTVVRARLAELPGSRDADEPSDDVSAAELDTQLRAIHAALSNEESQTVQLLAEELPLELRRNYFHKLAGMSVPDAVTYVRTELAQLGSNRATARGTGATATEIVLRNVAEPADDATRSGESPVSAATTPVGPNESTIAGEPLAAAHPEPSIVGAEPIMVAVIEELSADRHQLDLRTNDARELDQLADDLQEAGSAARAAVRQPSAPPAALPSADRLALDAAAHAHFNAIERALTLAERMRMHEIAAQRPASELRAWIDELANVPVPEAVARLRTALAMADGATPPRELKDIAPRTTQDAQQSQAPRAPHEAHADSTAPPPAPPDDTAPPLAALITSIEAAVTSGASAEARTVGAVACRSLSAVLEAKPGEPLVSPPLPATSPASQIAALLSQPGALSKLAVMSREQLLDLWRQVTGSMPARTSTPTTAAPSFHLIEIPQARRLSDNSRIRDPASAGRPTPESATHFASTGKARLQ